MARVVGIDHLSIRVSDYEKSKAFYGRLFAFLGFEVEAEYPGTIGWKNGHTLFWIGQAETGGRRNTTSATSASITTLSACGAGKTSMNWISSCARN